MTRALRVTILGDVDPPVPPVLEITCPACGSLVHSDGRELTKKSVRLEQLEGVEGEAEKLRRQNVALEQKVRELERPPAPAPAPAPLPVPDPEGFMVHF